VMNYGADVASKKSLPPTETSLETWAAHDWAARASHDADAGGGILCES
jgi:hypothetical protein